MTSFKLKQFGFAVLLMASLLVGSVSTCACSHHRVEVKPEETSCHGQAHESPESSATSEAGDYVDQGCVCSTDQSTPYIVSKSAIKKLKADKSISKTTDQSPEFQVASVASHPDSAIELTKSFSYSYVLRSLLPSRAPPRL